MPPVNASLNAIAAVLLLAGRVAIKEKRPMMHRNLMLAAFGVSTVFLTGYITYHATHGDTEYAGIGTARIIYFVVLTSHILCSLTVVPLALVALHCAWKKNFVRHKRLTRWLHPIWLYVSVTGVVVFFMLRPYYST